MRPVQNHAAVLESMLKDPAFKGRLAELGAEPVSAEKATPEALRSLLKSEIDKWTPVIRKTGVYAEFLIPLPQQ